MKRVWKILLLFCIAMLLEFCVFNFAVWEGQWKLKSLDAEQKNLVFTLEDITTINWKMDGDEYVSELDPQLFVPTDSMYLYSVSLQYETRPEVTSCTFYYSNPDGTVSAQYQTDVSEGQTSFQIDQMIGPILRIDLGEEAEVRLSEIQIVVNPMPQLHISISRIVAVSLIYLCGSLLFRIQKMPDYTRYIQKKEDD